MGGLLKYIFKMIKFEVILIAKVAITVAVFLRAGDLDSGRGK